jgi:hypothetical protein
LNSQKLEKSMLCFAATRQIYVLCVPILASLGLGACSSPAGPLGELNTAFQNFSASATAQQELADDLKARAEDAHEIYRELYASDYNRNKPVISEEEAKKPGVYIPTINLCRSKYETVLQNGYYSGVNTDTIDQRASLIKNLGGLVAQLVKIADLVRVCPGTSCGIA